MDLTVALADWTDWDLAAYHLGRCVGVFRDGDFATKHKGVFWTDSALGNGLHEALLALNQAGLLLRREEPDEQFRWRRTRE